MNTFLKTVTEELRRRGQPRTWLAYQSGITVSTINTWYHKDTWPRVDDAYKIAQGLGVSVDYLVSGNREAARGALSPHIQVIVDLLEMMDNTTVQVIRDLLMARAKVLARQAMDDNVVMFNQNNSDK